MFGIDTPSYLSRIPCFCLIEFEIAILEVWPTKYCRVVRNSRLKGIGNLTVFGVNIIWEKLQTCFIS